jgi:hypothetical protein
LTQLPTGSAFGAELADGVAGWAGRICHRRPSRHRAGEQRGQPDTVAWSNNGS